MLLKSSEWTVLSHPPWASSRLWDVIQARSGAGRYTHKGGCIGVAHDSRVALQTTCITHHFLCRLISYDIAKNVEMFECGQLICYYYYYYYYYYYRDCLMTD